MGIFGFGEAKKPQTTTGMEPKKAWISTKIDRCSSLQGFMFNNLSQIFFGCNCSSACNNDVIAQLRYRHGLQVVSTSLLATMKL